MQTTAPLGHCTASNVLSWHHHCPPCKSAGVWGCHTGQHERKSHTGFSCTFEMFFYWFIFNRVVSKVTVKFTGIWPDSKDYAHVKWNKGRLGKARKGSGTDCLGKQKCAALEKQWASWTVQAIWYSIDEDHNFISWLNLLIQVHTRSPLITIQLCKPNTRIIRWYQLLRRV